MTVFLWHQTAMMATTATGLLAGHLPGLHTPPDHLGWIAARLAWLPLFALALAVCWAAFHHLEQRTVARGVAVRRARIVSEPVTDYIRFEHAITHANERAGEQVRWLPRRRASTLTLPGNDFWLIDDRIVRWNLFSGDGQALEADHTEDADAVKLCTEAFHAVWDLATPHADYRL